MRTSLEESFGYTSNDPLQLSMGAQHTPIESIHQRQLAWTAASTNSQLLEMLAMEGSYEPEMLNERAVRVIRRVDNKLRGREFGEEVPVAQQVQRLIEAATSHDNLCVLFTGWCPFW